MSYWQAESSVSDEVYGDTRPDLWGQTVGIEYLGDEVSAWVKRDDQWVKLEKDDPLAVEILKFSASEERRADD